MSYASAIPGDSLYYITHVDNIKSILAKGILSHDKIITEEIKFAEIYDNQIVSNRSGIKTPKGDVLWNYANLYFQPRNAMLYRVVREKGVSNIAILGVRKSIVNTPGAYVTTGNAASIYTEIHPISEIKRIYSIIKKDLEREYWTESFGTKRAIMAEVLIPNNVTADYIDCIYVADNATREKVQGLIEDISIPINPEPQMFFQPRQVYPMTEKLSLLDGDMFFSKMQTITISVNCKGVMGRGNASRIKYQSPDVYVYYQDLCRNKSMRLGRPYLYKREASYEAELADEPYSLINRNHTKWFLLFPTKNDWRKNASYEGIEKGLQWVVNNYKRLEIESLALPALGCGLGNLDWKDIGPLMCDYLSKLDIPVEIYLPLERDLPQEYKSREFCLPNTLSTRAE